MFRGAAAAQIWRSADMRCSFQCHTWHDTLAALTSEMRTIKVNRPSALTLWPAIVAERLGFKSDEALMFGRAVAGMSAAIKGTRDL